MLPCREYQLIADRDVLKAEKNRMCFSGLPIDKHLIINSPTFQRSDINDRPITINKITLNGVSGKLCVSTSYSRIFPFNKLEFSIWKKSLYSEFESTKLFIVAAILCYTNIYTLGTRLTEVGSDNQILG